MKSKDFDIKIEINKDISKQTEKFLTLDIDKKSVRASSGESIDKNSAESKAKADELSESIKKQKKELKDLRKEIKETNASMKEAKKQYKEQEENVNSLTEKLKKAKEEHGKNSKQVKELNKELRVATKEFNKTRNSITASENTLTSLNGKVVQSKTELKGLKESFKEVSSTVGEKLSSSLSATGEKVSKVGEHFETVSGVLDNFSSIGDIDDEKLKTLNDSLADLGINGEEVFNSIPESVKNTMSSFEGLQEKAGALGAIGTIIGEEVGKIGGLISSLAGIGAPLAVVIGTLAIAIIICMAVVENFDNISAAMVRLNECIANSGIGESFTLLWTMLQEIWATVGEPLIAAIGELIVIVIDFITQAMPGISDAFAIVCELLMAAWEAIGKPVFDFIMLVVDEVVAWLGQYMPIIAEIFNSVMASLRNLWDTVGKPVFEILKAVIEAAIEAVKPILESLKNTFGSMVEAIQSVWEGLLKPVFDGIVSICGYLISKAMPYIDQFKSGVKTAMEIILSPIKVVSDAFGALMDIVSGVGKSVGSFLNKINPFKSIEGAIVVDYGYDYGMAPIMEGYSQVALSGQYYNSKSSLDSGLNQIIRTANGFISEPNYANNFFNGDLLADTIAAAIQNTLAANLNIAVNTSIDGRQVAKATAKYMDSEINTLNKRKLRYGGSF